MTVQRTSIRFGVGIGGFGALAHVVTVFLLFTLPMHLLGDEAGSAFVENWFDPISTVGGGLVFYMTPVLALLAGFYLVAKADVTVGDVLVGFAVGGLVFGLAVVIANWAVTAPTLRQSPVEYAIHAVRYTLRVFGPAFAGGVGAQFLTDRW